MTRKPQREISYDVRIWKTQKYEGRRVTTYTVPWWVAGKPWRQPHRTAALAESFRAQLLAAMRRGEAFDVATGRPISLVRDEAPPTSWYDFACQYADMKWPHISAKYRRGIAEALVTITCALLTEELPADEARATRSALQNWAFNTKRRGSSEQPDDVTRRTEWVAAHVRPVADLAQPEILRGVMDALASRLDGQQAAGKTTQRKRAVLSNALSYAVELGLLATNPVGSIKWRAPKTSNVVEKECVPNPTQARALLAAVKATPRSGERLYAFFACIYFSALRPEEAVNLRRSNLELPETGWGRIILREATPDTGGQWTDDGSQRQRRQLKHRAVGETRRVPCPPELVRILRWHLKTFGTDADGRLFVGEKGGELATVTYTRLWRRARETALGEQAAASLLARRPYDLRHAAVSTWLASSGDAAQVAEWAGHGVDVLLKVYAKVLDGQEEQALSRIQEALEATTAPGDLAEQRPRARQGRRGPRRRP